MWVSGWPGPPASRFGWAPLAVSAAAGTHRARGAAQSSAGTGVTGPAGIAPAGAENSLLFARPRTLELRI
jgi:hypothetical protein